MALLYLLLVTVAMATSCKSVERERREFMTPIFMGGIKNMMDTLTQSMDTVDKLLSASEQKEGAEAPSGIMATTWNALSYVYDWLVVKPMALVHITVAPLKMVLQYARDMMQKAFSSLSDMFGAARKFSKLRELAGVRKRRENPTELYKKMETKDIPQSEQAIARNQDESEETVGANKSEENARKNDDEDEIGSRSEVITRGIKTRGLENRFLSEENKDRETKIEKRGASHHKYSRLRSSNKRPRVRFIHKKWKKHPKQKMEKSRIETDEVLVKESERTDHEEGRKDSVQEIKKRDVSGSRRSSKLLAKKIQDPLITNKKGQLKLTPQLKQEKPKNNQPTKENVDKSTDDEGQKRQEVLDRGIFYKLKMTTLGIIDGGTENVKYFWGVIQTKSSDLLESTKSIVVGFWKTVWEKMGAIAELGSGKMRDVKTWLLPEDNKNVEPEDTKNDKPAQKAATVHLSSPKSKSKSSNDKQAVSENLFRLHKNGKAKAASRSKARNKRDTEEEVENESGNLKTDKDNALDKVKMEANKMQKLIFLKNIEEIMKRDVNPSGGVPGHQPEEDQVISKIV